ncbi:hypothetical protein ACHQM5_017643 [Ranunculus cassubicifolius]
MSFMVSFMLLAFASVTEVYAQIQKNHSVQAIFVFGDSTVDPGNNNYITTILKADFSPYGRDLPGQLPTGRFSNGKLTTDFIASHLGLKDFVPPYLDITLGLGDLMTGVSFASAGSGYDPLTAQTSRTIPMEKQLEYFKEYIAKMEGVVGKDIMKMHIQKSAFVISAGTNDFVFTYFTLPARSKQYNLTEYQTFLIQNTQNFIQSLLDLGARKIGIVGLPPIGCLPVVITTNSYSSILSSGCVNNYTEVAIEYNQKLQLELQTMMVNNSANKVEILYGDLYGAMHDIIQNYDTMGFDVWRRGCCGTGVLEFGILCNPRSFVCSDAAKYIFWDSIHPTKYMLFLAFRKMIDNLDMS